MKAAQRLLDTSAIGLSGLCLAHCLILPVAAALLPVLGAWAEAEWVHVVFVIVAAPVSALALFRGTAARRSQQAVLALAALGIAFLAIGAFAARTHIEETAVTIVGSLCLAAAHLLNWRRTSAANACETH